MTAQKIHTVKILIILVLFFTAVHLWVSFRRAAPDAAGALPAGAAGYPVGADETSLKVYAPFSLAVDSLLTGDYGLRESWIKNEPVQYDRHKYLRKTVQIPPDFATTLFNADLKQLADRYEWKIYSAQENIKTGDFSVEVGKDFRIYERIQMLVSKRMASETKTVSVLVSGFGLTYNDLTRAFIELPEPVTMVVPPGQEFSKIISHEARRAGKTVIFRVPERKNIIRFESVEPYDTSLVSRFYSVLRQAKDRDAIVFYEKKPVLDLLSAELPRLPKRGIRITPFTR